MRVLVTGATSMVGDFLLPKLVAGGHDVIATSRKPHAATDGVRWIQGDLKTDAWIGDVNEVDVWINLASLNLLPPLLREAAGRLHCRRVIAFSSTSRFTKADARGDQDRHIASSFAAGEHELESTCQSLGIGWTIFRPTLIYCLGRDKNLTLIASKIRQMHFFPLIGVGGGLRQPVHAEDLAMACIQAMDSEASVDKAYNLSGAQVLSYHDMVERLFEKQGLSPRFIHVPLALYRVVLQLFRLLPKYRYLTPDMADRMEKDMVFAHDDASRDFGYAPRSFQP